MKMNRVTIFLLGVLVGSYIGALAHERDIALNCRKYGNSGHAGWTVRIEAQEMKVNK
jgi:hypothetical protein